MPWVPQGDSDWRREWRSYDKHECQDTYCWFQNPSVTLIILSHHCRFVRLCMATFIAHEMQLTLKKKEISKKGKGKGKSKKPADADDDSDKTEVFQNHVSSLTRSTIRIWTRWWSTSNRAIQKFFRYDLNCPWCRISKHVPRRNL